MSSLSNRRPDLRSGASGRFGRTATSQLFLHLNLGKHSVTADRTTPAGWSRILELAKQCDVILVPPGVDRAAIAAQNDQAVVCLISDFGEDRAATGLARRGNDPSGAVGCDVPERQWPDREPLYGVGHRASYTAGVAAYTAALSAIFARRGSGAARRFRSMYARPQRR